MGEATRVALVTGGNRGLGYEVCRALASRGMRVLLASRDPARGKAAARALRGAGLDVSPVVMDVRSDDDVARAAENVGPVDVLVNNAGILPDRGGPEGTSVFRVNIDLVREAMETNAYGALRTCRAFVPGMRERGWGRVVNVSTGMAQLTEMNGGWPAYRLSKTALSAVTRIVADETRGRGVLVNAVCPGWVRTDMGGPQATRSVEEGAAGIVWAATLEDGGPTGGFFRDGKQIPW